MPSGYTTLEKVAFSNERAPTEGESFFRWQGYQPLKAVHVVFSQR
jgi:hypothetical protein